MLVHGIICPCCNTILYSRVRHDYVICECRYCATDCGQEDYIKINWGLNQKDVGIPISISLEVDVTQQQLYEDWITNKNKFGKIKGGIDGI